MSLVPCQLDGRRFLLPQQSVLVALPASQVASVPYAPAGVCGLVVCQLGAVAVLDPWGARMQPAPLQVVCLPADGSQAQGVAYTADCVESPLRVGLDVLEAADYDSQGLMAVQIGGQSYVLPTLGKAVAQDERADG